MEKKKGISPDKIKPTKKQSNEIKTGLRDKTLNNMHYLICSHCGYAWFYKGGLMYATCPNCHYKLNVEKYEVTA